MRGHEEEPRVEQLAGLRAPALTHETRQRLRKRILWRAAPLLARRRRLETWWDVLGRWARPGLVAAAASLALLAGAVRFASRSHPAPVAPVALEDVLRADSGDVRPPDWLLDSREPDATAVVEAALLAPNPNTTKRDR
jgi:anti-sigma-K factor RskA